MQQDVNLYRFLPQPTQLRFTSEMAIWLYGGFVTLLLLSYLLGLWQTHRDKVQLHATEIQLEQTKQNLAALTAQYPSLDPKDIQNSVLQFQKELQTQNKIIHLLSRNAKFSGYLTGLAQATVSGVWLTEIDISASEQKIKLQGHALTFPLLQQFLQQLMEQPVFSDMLFELRNVEQDLDEVPPHHFLMFDIENKPKAKQT